MLEYTNAELGAYIGAHLWPLFRIASFMMAVPVIGTQLVPVRIRLGLALLVSIVVVPTLGPVPEVDPLSLASVGIVFQQVVIGTAMGFMLQMLFQVFVTAGQMMAMQMGLGLGALIDPATGLNTTSVSQFFLITVTLLFLAMNGHLVMIEVLVESFRTLPISTERVSTDFYWELVSAISWMFAAALLISLPAVTALLIVFLAFGVMNRAAQQLNVFALGFPINMVLGMFVIAITLTGSLPKYQSIVEEALLFLRRLVGA